MLERNGIYKVTLLKFIGECVNLESMHICTFTVINDSSVPKSKRVASNFSCYVSESIVTHCSPGAVMIAHFKTSFSRIRSSDQSRCIRQSSQDKEDLRVVQYTFWTVKHCYNCFKRYSFNICKHAETMQTYNMHSQFFIFKNQN